MSAPAVDLDIFTIEGLQPPCDNAPRCERPAVWIIRYRCPRGCGADQLALACDPCWQAELARLITAMLIDGCLQCYDCRRVIMPPMPVTVEPINRKGDR